MREKLSKALKVLALIVLLGGIVYNLRIVGQFLLEIRIAEDSVILGLVQLGILLSSIVLVPEMRSSSDHVLFPVLLLFCSVFPAVILFFVLVTIIPWFIKTRGGPVGYYFILGIICSLPMAARWLHPYSQFRRREFTDSSWMIVLGWILVALVSGFLVQFLAKLILIDENQDVRDSHSGS
jgi:hypothetical protein